MNDLELNKVQKFVQDTAMVNAVYSVIKDTFLKSKGQRDIQILAAERLAVDLLENAFRELNKFKVSAEEKSTINSQVGL